MKNQHILDLIDSKAFADLSADERSTVKTHSAACESCARAVQATRISSVLLRADTFENFAAPPAFFQTKVLANLRQKQARVKPLAAFWKMWTASKTLVATMGATVAVLILLTVFAPQFNQNQSDTASATSEVFDDYSTEMVILNEKIPAREPTNDQIFQVVYAAEK
ncbi:MAG: hypothetical protein H0U87_08640 [Acidobacteria bacterium]|jgi:anti-sigma factor RsiW|nr:hypothetical protein [Acidobacteriota bacterium]